MEALIIVDVQYDFLPGGALAVKQGDQVTAIINRLMPLYGICVATQDWHPSDHGSFASQHPGMKPGDIIKLNSLEQVLWPDHCVQNTHGADLEHGLDLDQIEKVFQKGTDRGIDSYSGFFDNGHLKSTGLADYLKDKGVQDVSIVGLATDYCVKFTALDAVELGFSTTLIADATRAVNLQPNDYDLALSDMADRGVRIRQSNQLLT